MTIPSYRRRPYQEKMQPWSLPTSERTSQRGDSWCPSVFTGPTSSGQTGKTQVGRQLKQVQYGANAKTTFFFFHFEDTTLVSMPSLKWIAWRERLWCDNHSQVNLSSVISAQGIQSAISRKTKKHYRRRRKKNVFWIIWLWYVGWSVPT